MFRIERKQIAGEKVVTGSGTVVSKDGVELQRVKSIQINKISPNEPLTAKIEVYFEEVDLEFNELEFIYVDKNTGKKYMEVNARGVEVIPDAEDFKAIQEMG